MTQSTSAPLLLLFTLLPLAAACRPAPPEPTRSLEDIPMTLEITSSAIAAGEAIPKKYTGDGADVSPPLAWTNVPEGTQSLALICDDPDAPGGPWAHWVLYNLPADTSALPEGLPREAELSSPLAQQGVNTFASDNTGYRGPAPPAGHGVHHYHFRVFALDRMLELPSGATNEVLVMAMMGHLLAGGELVGTYERKE